MAIMWIDERGSDVLDLPECRRLLAVGANERRHGHLGIGQGTDQAPVVLPVDYAVDDMDIVLQIGEGLFEHVVGRLVAFEVDGTDGQSLFATDHERPWSVLIRGLATEDHGTSKGGRRPTPRVIEPGDRVVRIRCDVVTGRRLTLSPTQAAGSQP